MGLEKYTYAIKELINQNEVSKSRSCRPFITVVQIEKLYTNLQSALLPIHFFSGDVRQIIFYYEP